VLKQYILWLEISVNQRHVLVQEVDRANELGSKVCDARGGIRSIVVRLHETIERAPELLEDEADVTIMLKPIEHLHVV
jgi:hypothetical protein|tara:strand:- start:262 stop:495 length:234 start_codon:yes stop_codon:yes gene_type:complete